MDRLRLAPLRSSDAEALQAITDDPVVIDNIIFLSAPFTLDDARALIAGEPGHVFYGAWHNGTGDLVGVVGTHLTGSDEIEIGYWMATRFAGQGYASEAAAGVIELLCAQYPARTIFAECRPGNLASWRVLEKLGFCPTGEEGQRSGRKKLVLTRP
jgi:RimJ/RimL family protein N-acetyltransferase